MFVLKGVVKIQDLFLFISRTLWSLFYYEFNDVLQYMIRPLLPGPVTNFHKFRLITHDMSPKYIETLQNV